MDTPNITKDLTGAAGSVFSFKNVVTIAFIIVIVMLLFNWIFKQDLVDENGNTLGTSKFKLRSFKKKEKTN